MSESINWWNLKLGERHRNYLNAAFDSKKLSYNSVGSSLEKKISDLFKVKHCLLTTSGSTALLVALKSMSIGPGDEVIIPNRTFQATANAVYFTGATVVIADVNLHDGLISAAHIEKLITAKTKAILPVHLNGRGCDMIMISDVAKKYGLFVIEDTAQAFMSCFQNKFLGTFGDVGCFSLGVTKFMTTGQGGFLITNSDEIYETSKNYIFHAASGDNVKQFSEFGFNFRLSDLLSSLALADMENIEQKRQKYLEIYQLYAEKIGNCNSLSLIPSNIESDEFPIWIEVLCESRDKLFNYLKENGIESVKSYPSLHRSAYLKHQHLQFPNSKIFEENGLILPCGPDITLEQIDVVARKICNF